MVAGGFLPRGLGITSLLSAYIVVLLVLLVSSVLDLQVTLAWFAAQCEVTGMRISTSESEGGGAASAGFKCLGADRSRTLTGGSVQR